MAKEIGWSKTALKDLERIECYIRESFGKKSALKFLDELESVLNSVSLFSGNRNNNNGRRKCERNSNPQANQSLLQGRR